ncbi:odorant response protein ODR-4 [Anopheles darlingi]|uniref:Odorant response protein ODR-4 n=1 Tax=Anopheles darlingi TaxID=43151 RepID=W5J8C1_ANODA|nr:odorant response protein ODR-4 [Anopheles darlingi]
MSVLSQNRKVLCDAKVEEYLLGLGQKGKICVGLLIGQPSLQQTDYIVHANVLKERDPDSDTGTQDLAAADDVSEHALVETRMLPGGMYVLGLFVVHPKNIFEDNALLQRVKRMLLSMKASFDANPLLMGYCDELTNGGRIVLHIPTKGNQLKSKMISLAAENPTVSPCDWKRADKTTKWHQFSTYFDTDDVCPLRSKSGKEQQYETEANLTECAKTITEQLAEAKVLFNSELMPAKENVRQLFKAGSKEGKTQVRIYVPSPTTLSDQEATIEQLSGALKFDGIVSSKVYVHDQCSFYELERFIKSDIVRSLMARIQIHCDSLVQLDSDPQDKITLNELPRRLYFPIQPNVPGYPQFTEYLFPDEETETVLGPIQAMLDLELDAEHINSTVEIVPAVKEEERHDAKECGGGSVADGTDGEVKLNSSTVTTIVGAVVLLIAVVAYFLLK